MTGKKDHVKVMSRFKYNSEQNKQFKTYLESATIPYLADSAVPASLYVVLALVAGVHKAVLALVVQLYQHTHCAPFASSQGAELPVLVPGQSQKGITAIHQVTGQQRVGVHDGWQGVNDWPGMEVDDKKHLVVERSGTMLVSCKDSVL